jgi:hypothetical protein
MMKVDVAKLMGTAALAGLLTIGGAAWADSPTVPGSAPNSADQIVVMPAGESQFSSSGLGRTGNFVGTLVARSCDSGRPAGTRAECEADGHYYGLAIDGQSAVYTLMAGAQVIQYQLGERPPVGSKVEVTGIAYPSTGAILVSNIRPSSDSREGFLSLSTR